MALAGHLLPAVGHHLLIAPVPMPARLRLKCRISHPCRTIVTLDSMAR
jgi:hypothetical protein